MSRRGDFFSLLALAAITYLTGGLATPQAAAAFVARTALVIGISSVMQRRAQSKARELARTAQTGAQQGYTVTAVDHPIILPYGRCVVPTVIVYGCEHGAGNRYVTMVFAVPCDRRIDAFERILFDDVDIGELDAQGYVMPGSRWYRERIVSTTTTVAGAAPGLVVTLGHTAGDMIAVDTVAWQPNRPSELSGEAATDFDTLAPVALPASQYTVSPANVVTVSRDTQGGSVVVTYRYKAGRAHVRVIRNLGEAAGGNFGTLTTDSGGEWTANCRLCGIPNLVITFEADDEGTLWANGLPRKVVPIVRGLRVYDATLDSSAGGSGSHRLADPATWAWEDSAEAAWRDYMRAEVECTEAEINAASVRAAAAVCRAMVPLRGGGSERAFTVNGWLSTADRWEENVEKLATAMIGNAVYSAGQWHIAPYGWSAPQVTLEQSSVRGGAVTTDPHPEADESFNIVRGRFVDTRATQFSPGGLYTLQDFPPVRLAAYIVQDQGEESPVDLELPLTVGVERAQRMARFWCIRARNAYQVRAPFDMSAYRLRPMTRVRLPWPRYNWAITQDGGTGKVFLVLGWKFSPPGTVELVLKEDAAALYNWNATDAALLNATPNSGLASPTFVAPIAGVTVRADRTTFFVSPDGVVVPYVEISWTRPAANDVSVEVYWKRAPEVEYRRIVRAVGDTQAWLERVAPGEVINAYLFGVNGIGARSAITWLPSLTVGADVPSGRPAISANGVRNAAFDRNVARWRIWESGVSGVASFGLHQTAGYRIRGTPSSAYLTIASTLSGNGYACGVIGSEMSVAPGDRVVAFADVLGWGTDVLVQVAFRRADGTWIETRLGNLVAGVAVESAARRFDRAEHHQTSALIAVAPAGARYAEPMVVAAGNWSGDALKYFSVHKPFIGRLPAGVSTLPPWDPGGHNVVDTADIAERATDEVIVRRLAAPVVVQPLGSAQYHAELPFLELPLIESSSPHANAVVEVRAAIALAARGTIATPIPSHELRAGLAIMRRDLQGNLINGSAVAFVDHAWQREWATPRPINEIESQGIGSATLDPITYSPGERISFGFVLVAVTAAGTAAENARFLGDGFTYTAGLGTHIAVNILKNARL